jgi:hypothetical protein
VSSFLQVFFGLPVTAHTQMKLKLSRTYEALIIHNKSTAQQIVTYLSTSGLPGHSTVEYFSPLERETNTYMSNCIPNLEYATC